MSQTAGHVQTFPNYRVRQTVQANQPRYVVAKRLNSVRMNWFMLGTLSGMALCFTFNTLMGGLFNGQTSQPEARIAAALKLETTSASANIAAPKAIESYVNNTDDAQTPANDTPEATKEGYPRSIKYKLKKGETLASILTDHAIGYQHAHQAIASLRKSFNPRSLRAGQELAFTVDKTTAGDLVLSKLEIKKNRIESVMLTRSSDGKFTTSNAKKQLEPELTLAGGTITNSLFETGYANGIPDGVLAELMQAYSYDVDFQREIKRGDQVEVLFEKMVTDEGEAAGYGDIIYATLKLHGKPISIYRHEKKDGRAGFYNEKGESVKKALLKTPINGARMSSGFGRRKHPILGYTKMHTGTDFAAARGTPIYASGDGIITYKGRKGGYGNYIQIKHNGTYSSAYAHMSRFANSMRKGRKVKQGQVIGYVGTTGRSTGPHLHYEVIKNGRKVNPMGEKFKTGDTLKGTELANFKAQIGKLKQQIASMPHAKRTVASAQ